MKLKYNAIMSENGSVRFIDGTFYDSNFREVFVPLTNAEYHSFCKRVEDLEKTLGRKLSYAEISGIVSLMETEVI
jgi:hypothetical protein